MPRKRKSSGDYNQLAGTQMREHFERKPNWFSTTS